MGETFPDKKPKIVESQKNPHQIKALDFGAIATNLAIIYYQ